MPSCIKYNPALREAFMSSPETAPAKVRDSTALQFLPAALEILETPASPVGRAVAGTIMAFFLALAWGAVGKVDIIATASGKIVPSARTKTIQPLETGIVQAIHVRDGDHVSAGQILIELNGTVTNAERSRAGHDLLSAQLDVADCRRCGPCLITMRRRDLIHRQQRIRTRSNARVLA
jgi:multidrug efflux pump subunit AcrA (membrane-fusion protein)